MSNRIAIVTGASRGIGAATALALGKQGYAVCVNYKANKTKADEVAAAITKSGGRAITVQADIGKESDVIRLFKTVDDELGPVTALVNNAALQNVGAVADASFADWQTVFNANVFGLILCCREAVTRMKKADKGAIVNVSSEAARFGGKNMLAYAASKGAVNTLTLGLARELAPMIRVNAISPGVIDTDAQQAAPADVREKRVAMIPTGRMGNPDEVASAIAWLLSDAASYVTGTVLPVTGGR